MARTPAVIKRLACAIARSGLVANLSACGIPACARRCGSVAQHSGMYTSKSIHACPSAVTSAANTQVTQFSTVPVTPACCGETHAVNGPFRRSGQRSRRTQAPGRSGHPGLRTPDIGIKIMQGWA